MAEPGPEPARPEPAAVPPVQPEVQRQEPLSGPLGDLRETVRHVAVQMNEKMEMQRPPGFFGKWFRKLGGVFLGWGYGKASPIPIAGTRFVDAQASLQAASTAFFPSADLGGTALAAKDVVKFGALGMKDALPHAAAVGLAAGLTAGYLQIAADSFRVLFKKSTYRDLLAKKLAKDSGWTANIYKKLFFGDRKRIEELAHISEVIRQGAVQPGDYSESYIKKMAMAAFSADLTMRGLDVMLGPKEKGKLKQTDRDYANLVKSARVTAQQLIDRGLTREQRNNFYDDYANKMKQMTYLNTAKFVLVNGAMTAAKIGPIGFASSILHGLGSLVAKDTIVNFVDRVKTHTIAGGTKLVGGAVAGGGQVLEGLAQTPAVGTVVGELKNLGLVKP